MILPAAERERSVHCCGNDSDRSEVSAIISRLDPGRNEKKDTNITLDAESISNYPHSLLVSFLSNFSFCTHCYIPENEERECVGVGERRDNAEERQTDR